MSAVLGAQRGIAACRRSTGAPKTPVVLDTPTTGANATAVTSTTVTLPTHTDTANLLLLVARNVTSTTYSADNGLTLTEQAQVGTRRLTALTLTAPAATTSFAITGASGLWSWACFNMDTATFGASATNAIGNSTTAAIEIPSVSISAADGAELAVGVAMTNSTAIWTASTEAQLVGLTAAPGLFVASQSVTAGATSVTFGAPSRGNEGTSRNESTLAFVLEAP